MKNYLNIGCIIADIDEFAPLYDKKEELGAEEISVFKRKGLRFCLKDGEKSVTVTLTFDASEDITIIVIQNVKS